MHGKAAVTATAKLAAIMMMESVSRARLSCGHGDVQMCQALSDIALSSDSSAFHCALHHQLPGTARGSLVNIKRSCHAALRNAAAFKC